MFFPIGDDDSQVGLTPLVTWSFVGLNVLVFLYQMSLPPQSLEHFFLSYATIPQEIVSGRDLPPTIGLPVYVTLLTAMFMHGGIMHIVGNMVYLWVFGNNIEAALGHVRYAVFYLGCGIIAGLAHVLVNTASSIPSLGASGAISGVLGAYLVMFPQGRVRMLTRFGVTYMPAWSALGLWIVLQLIMGYAERGQAGGGVAYAAHIGGFFAGMLLGPMMRIRRVV